VSSHEALLRCRDLLPLAIAREAGIPIEVERVDIGKEPHLTQSGADFNTINAKGYVPALVLDDGQVLTEGAAIVQFLADLAPQSRLAPAADSVERYRLQEWLTFISSELHKMFSPWLFHPEFGENAAQAARAKIAQRFAFLESHLAKHSYLLGEDFRSRCLRVRDRRLGSPQADRARAVSAPEELHGADRRAPQGPRGNARGGSAASGRSRMSSAVAWLTLFAAGVLDVLWAVTMKYAAGYTKLGWSIASLALLAAFVFLLGRSLQVLPVGTAYAVWTGVGATGTVLMGVVLFGETLDPIRVGCIALVVIGIVGLKLQAE
jgi:multidrug transporter EmrE-like cation transporter